MDTLTKKTSIWFCGTCKSNNACSLENFEKIVKREIGVKLRMSSRIIWCRVCSQEHFILIAKSFHIY